MFYLKVSKDDSDSDKRKSTFYILLIEYHPNQSDDFIPTLTWTTLII